MLKNYKKIIALSIIFFIFLYSASSLKVFTVQETDTISLRTDALDPDNDSLVYIYSEPLDENGQWQTTYGDAGSYNSSVRVSDGIQEITERILIIVSKRQEKPIIVGLSPEQNTLSLDEGKKLLFQVNASDLNNDPLGYQWMIDNRQAGSSKDLTYGPTYGAQGHHSIELIVSDGTDFISHIWDVQVNDVDLDVLFNDIRDINIEETQIAALQLPDFGAYGLEYEISEPLGNDNIWQSGYDDSGEYPTTIFVSGNGYERKKNVVITVSNKDRPPLISVADKKVINENEKVEFLIEAQDPDGDNITLSADNLPQDATFEGNTLIWTPGFNEVQKQKAFDYLLDNFRILSKARNIEIVAMSGQTRTQDKIKIIVHDVNQPFAWEPMPKIKIKEGEEIILEPKYTDADNDKVSFAYSGYMVTERKKTDFDDSGQYLVKVKATDGYYTQTQLVDIIVEDVNREPQFKDISERTVMEGQELLVKLKARDPDSPDILFSSDDLPENAHIKDNELIWTPPFDTTNVQTKVTIPIVVSDGISQTNSELQVNVMNVNRAPKILESSNTQVAFVDQTALFEVSAIDEDGDVLKYSWDLGLFETYEGENTHARKFSSAGEKEISVSVSDGKSEAKKMWHVRVI